MDEIPLKKTTVVGTCGHITVTVEAYPWETEKQTRIRCAIELERMVEEEEDEFIDVDLLLNDQQKVDATFAELAFAGTASSGHNRYETTARNVRYRQIVAGSDISEQFAQSVRKLNPKISHEEDVLISVPSVKINGVYTNVAARAAEDEVAALEEKILENYGTDIEAIPLEKKPFYELLMNNLRKISKQPHFKTLHEQEFNRTQIGVLAKNVAEKLIRFLTEAGKALRQLFTPNTGNVIKKLRDFIQFGGDTGNSIEVVEQVFKELYSKQLYDKGFNEWVPVTFDNANAEQSLLDMLDSPSTTIINREATSFKRWNKFCDRYMNVQSQVMEMVAFLNVKALNSEADTQFTKSLNLQQLTSTIVAWNRFFNTTAFAYDEAMVDQLDRFKYVPVYQRKYANYKTAKWYVQSFAQDIEREKKIEQDIQGLKQSEKDLLEAVHAAQSLYDAAVTNTVVTDSVTLDKLLKAQKALADKKAKLGNNRSKIARLTKDKEEIRKKYPSIEDRDELVDQLEGINEVSVQLKQRLSLENKSLQTLFDIFDQGLSYSLLSLHPVARTVCNLHGKAANIDDDIGKSIKQHAALNLYDHYPQEDFEQQHMKHVYLDAVSESCNGKSLDEYIAMATQATESGASNTFKDVNDILNPVQVNQSSTHCLYMRGSRQRHAHQLNIHPKKFLHLPATRSTLNILLDMARRLEINIGQLLPSDRNIFDNDEAVYERVVNGNQVDVLLIEKLGEGAVDTNLFYEKLKQENTTGDPYIMQRARLEDYNDTKNAPMEAFGGVELTEFRSEKAYMYMQEVKITILKATAVRYAQVTKYGLGLLIPDKSGKVAVKSDEYDYKTSLKSACLAARDDLQIHLTNELKQLDKQLKTISLQSTDVEADLANTVTFLQSIMKQYALDSNWSLLRHYLQISAQYPDQTQAFTMAYDARYQKQIIQNTALGSTGGVTTFDSVSNQITVGNALVEAADKEVELQRARTVFASLIQPLEIVKDKYAGTMLLNSFMFSAIESSQSQYVWKVLNELLAEKDVPSLRTLIEKLRQEKNLKLIFDSETDFTTDNPYWMFDMYMAKLLQKCIATNSKYAFLGVLEGPFYSNEGGASLYLRTEEDQIAYARDTRVKYGPGRLLDLLCEITNVPLIHNAEKSSILQKFRQLAQQVNDLCCELINKCANDASAQCTSSEGIWSTFASTAHDNCRDANGCKKNDDCVQCTVVQGCNVRKDPFINNIEGGGKFNDRMLECLHPLALLVQGQSCKEKESTLTKIRIAQLKNVGNPSVKLKSSISSISSIRTERPALKNKQQQIDNQQQIKNALNRHRDFVKPISDTESDSESNSEFNEVGAP